MQVRVKTPLICSFQHESEGQFGIGGHSIFKFGRAGESWQHSAGQTDHFAGTFRLLRSRRRDSQTLEGMDWRGSGEAENAEEKSAQPERGCAGNTKSYKGRFKKTKFFHKYYRFN